MGNDDKSTASAALSEHWREFETSWHVEHVNATLPKDQRLLVIRCHDPRHTAVKLMLPNGEQPRIVQVRLGHADISMSLGRYSHVTNDMQREAADRLAQFLSSSCDQIVTNSRSRPLRIPPA